MQKHAIIPFNEIEIYMSEMHEKHVSLNINTICRRFYLYSGYTLNLGKIEDDLIDNNKCLCVEAARKITIFVVSCLIYILFLLLCSMKCKYMQF